MKNITAFELKEKIENGEQLHIIDVREEFEVAMGKIPGADHIALYDIPNSLNKINKNNHYYMICQSGGRSASACQFLTDLGYDVTNVAGGMIAWSGRVE